MQEICDHARKIFEEKHFIMCICDGMQNKVSFVRYAFIAFCNYIVEKMHVVIGDNKLQIGNHIVELTNTFTGLLGMVDISPASMNAE